MPVRFEIYCARQSSLLFNFSFENQKQMNETLDGLHFYFLPNQIISLEIFVVSFDRNSDCFKRVHSYTQTLFVYVYHDLFCNV